MRFLSPVLTLAAVLCAAARISAADTPVHDKSATPIHISHGEPITLSDFTVPGKTTIFDFYSEYCPPCRAIGPHLEKLHEARADVSVVKIDINRPGHKGIDWQSPVAQQFGLQSIPHFTIIGPDGAKQADGEDAYNKVAALIESAEGNK